jgi:hypothetical protein
MVRKQVDKEESAIKEERCAGVLGDVSINKGMHLPKRAINII